MFGPALRCNQEHGDAVWVVATATSEAASRYTEAVLAARYGIPTVPFVARNADRAGDRSLVGSQVLLDRLFEELDTEKRGLRLLADGSRFRLSAPFGECVQRVRRRSCGPAAAERGAVRRPARSEPDAPDLDVRIRRRGARGARVVGPVGAAGACGSPGWRFETASADMATLTEIADRISAVLPVSVRCVARLARNGPVAMGNTLPFLPAASVRPGMVMVDVDGEFDVVSAVERVAIDAPVYDLDIARTHNFVADGVVTHNSIYKFRGADYRNLAKFEETFPDATIIVLDQNYRSTQRILDAANAVIANNAARRPKHLWTEQGDGAPIVRYEAEDEHDEASFVVGEIRRLTDNADHRFGDLAVFYRTNAQSRVVEESLVRAGIPYRVFGGVKFYDRREVKDALAYLRAREPRRRGVVEAHRQHAQARRGRHVGREGVGLRAGRGRHVPRGAGGGRHGRSLGPGARRHPRPARSPRRDHRRGRRRGRAHDRGRARAHRLPRRAAFRALGRVGRAASRTCKS